MAGFPLLIGLQLLAEPNTTASLTPARNNTARHTPVPSIRVGLVLPPNIGISPVPAPNINERLLKLFQESFPDAQKVVWGESKDFYSVGFVSQNILHRITYEKNGAFASAIRYYTERALPYYLINVVKHKYPHMKVYGVTEITNEDGIQYYIKLENPKYWLSVLFDSNGTSTVQEKYRKAE